MCFDFFAVITYITEYFTKDESHTSVFLNQAAKKCSELGQIEQKRLLKNTFLTHREMGISEAFMKLLPEMKFKDSNIGTEFLQVGKRQDMSRFIVRADEEEEKKETHSEIFFTISNREGLYYEKPNWMDKYFRKGKLLNNKICPSHFVKMYDPIFANKKHKTKGKKMEMRNTRKIRRMSILTTNPNFTISSQIQEIKESLYQKLLNWKIHDQMSQNF